MHHAYKFVVTRLFQKLNKSFGIQWPLRLSLPGSIPSASRRSRAVFKNSLYRVAQKTSQNLRNYNGAYTLWVEISFGIFVDQYVLLLTYKFQ